MITFFTACKRQSGADTAFYYWKGSFQLDKDQQQILRELANDQLYLRFFDIKWDTKGKQPYPEAIVSFKDSIIPKNITPVVFITNQTFENLDSTQVDSLAIKTNKLIIRLAGNQKISYEAIQIDCDWTVGTKDKFFKFLTSFKSHSKKKLEATIRLHQVKYQTRTGVPPVDRGILMFYNMGKLSADLKGENSIYNPKDAETYISYLPKYRLPLDIALPLFSWSIHIRNGAVIQVYGKIGRKELENKTNFGLTANANVYVSKNNFFSGGIYVKTGDLFKLEESNKQSLTQAATQLARHLNKKEKRTIIYYELSNLDLSTFKTSDLKEISTYF